MSKRKKGGQIDNTNAEVWDEKKLIEIGERLIEWLNSDDRNIFFREFLQEEGLYNEFISRHKDVSSFVKLINSAKEIQELKLLKFGCFSKKINQAMIMFVLKNHHEYKDRVDYTSQGEKIDNKVVINNEPKVELPDNGRS